MRIIAFIASNGQPALGLRTGSQVVNLTAAGLPSTLDELLKRPDGLNSVKDAAARATQHIALAQVKLLPPLQNPSKAFAIGLNYVDHAWESNFEPPKHPVLFQRFPSSWVAHGEPLVRPKVSTQFDYEAELVAVIGKAGRYIAKEDALAHVAGKPSSTRVPSAITSSAPASGCGERTSIEVAGSAPSSSRRTNCLRAPRGCS